MPLQHWRTEWREHDGEKQFVCQMDVRGAAVNTLFEPVLRELGLCLEEAEQGQAHRFVLMSAKASGFCYGADIGALQQAGIELAEDLEEAHRIINRLDYFPGGTVAVITGACFGGGLELALACDYRIATPDARFAFPEVKLGLHPGLGASWRLPHQIAAPEALDMMLSGRTVQAKPALHRHLIDEIVPPYLLEQASKRCRVKAESRLEKIKNRAVEVGPARAMIATVARRKLTKQVNEDHYPAPYALLDLWENDGGKRDILFAERASFVELAQSERVKNLLHVFRLREKLKAKARGYAQHTRLPSIEHVHVLGAGTMGGAIAAWVALKGYRVSLHDPDPQQIASAVAEGAHLFSDKQDKEAGARTAMDRLIPDPNNRGISQADLVIEAVPEKLSLKQQVMSEVAEHARPDAIVATNTSSFPLDDLAFSRPEQLVGLHFFNPVAAMPLVEVVHGEHTAVTALAVASVFGERIGKLPLTVKSRPGFLVNRILTAYLLEAMLLYDEGYAAEDIDAAAEAFGMRQGPLQTADRVGLDVCLDVGKHLADVLPDADRIPESLQRMVDEGRLGVKTGRGFFPYNTASRGDQRDTGAQRQKPSAEIPEIIQNRLNLALLNMAVACWRERIVDSEDELDAGLIFGAGFAPFRGGPMHYLHASNERQLLRQLKSLSDTYPRFKPDEGWDSLAA